MFWSPWLPWWIICYETDVHYRVATWEGGGVGVGRVMGVGSDILHFNTLRPRGNEQDFADDIFKRIFFNENVWISIKISLKFVPKGPINNFPALVQIMAWHRSGDKPLSEQMMVNFPTHICVTRPQWVNWMYLYVNLFVHYSILDVVVCGLVYGNAGSPRDSFVVTRPLLCVHIAHARD